MSSATSNFSLLSANLTKRLSKTEKKANGIYFTPQPIVRDLTTRALNRIKRPIHSVLEPSCGTCEFIQYIDSILSDIHIDGVEYNAEIYGEISKLEFQRNAVRIQHANFLNLPLDRTYDLVVGNPPYVVCKKTDVPDEYLDYVVGRPNLFGIFILRSLQHLEPDGILAFVVPKSVLNSSYYSAIRLYIKQWSCIEEIVDYETSDGKSFLETSQATVGIILRKYATPDLDPSQCAHSIKMNGSFIFAVDAVELRNYFVGSNTIRGLGLSVRTGTIVWNQHKDLMSDNPADTLLIYNTNVSDDNQIVLTEFRNEEKQQYIRHASNSCDNNPIIVVNRGNGNSTYRFKYALVESDRPVLVENHLNMIYSTVDRPHEELMELYGQVLRSFQDERTHKFIEMFFGNGGLSKTELETILPIYL